jgi:hypothetical protein
MVSPVVQARIARLQKSFLLIYGDYDHARLSLEATGWAAFSVRMEGYGTALKLLDACLAIEEGFTQRDGDHAVVARLREIAAARDLLRCDRPAAPAPAADDAVGAASTP